MTVTTAAITLDDAWARVNAVCSDNEFSSRSDAAKVFRKLVRECDIFRLEPDEMALYLVNCLKYSEGASQYFEHEGLHEREVDYYVWMCVNGKLNWILAK